MRTRVALLLAGALVLGACGQSDDASDPEATATATAPDTATDAPTDAAQAETVSADLPDGVAATVADTEIQEADLEERLALIREIPEMQQQLEGEGADQVEAQLQSQVLGQLVLQEVVLQAAAEEGVEVDDARVDEERQALAEQAGGEDAFAEQLASGGVPEDQLDDELRASIAFEIITERLMADAGVESGTETEAATEGGTEAATEGGTEQPGAEAQQVQQEWLLELVTSADVVVDEAYGAWDPSMGQVVPAA